MDEDTQAWGMDWILFSFEPVQSRQDKLPLKLRMPKNKKSKVSCLGRCLKCQKRIGRGLFMHQKFCEG